jgi:ssDNA-binding Zn-finger/Zn-ribbon topoisomerase 1
MSTAAPERQTSANSCPKCGGTEIKTWAAYGRNPRAMCLNPKCKHKWSLFVAAWKEQGEQKEIKR